MPFYCSILLPFSFYPLPFLLSSYSFYNLFPLLSPYFSFYIIIPTFCPVLILFVSLPPILQSYVYPFPSIQSFHTLSSFLSCSYSILLFPSILLSSFYPLFLLLSFPLVYTLLLSFCSVLMLFSHRSVFSNSLHSICFPSIFLSIVSIPSLLPSFQPPSILSFSLYLSNLYTPCSFLSF